MPTSRSSPIRATSRPRCCARSRRRVPPTCASRCNPRGSPSGRDRSGFLHAAGGERSDDDAGTARCRARRRATARHRPREAHAARRGVSRAAVVSSPRRSARGGRLGHAARRARRAPCRRRVVSAAPFDARRRRAVDRRTARAGHRRRTRRARGRRQRDVSRARRRGAHAAVGHGARIRYRYVPDALPLGDYQTIFARVPGSAEMPSAGRPFSLRSLDDVRESRVAVATVTLHTGVSSPERHERPYREWFDVPAPAAVAVNATRARGGRVVAVGTTVVRALESAVRGGEATAASGWTDLIVTPERGVAVVDGLLTGFHEPEASHLDLLRAFADDALLERAYGHALGAGYLWHEFGDVHLLL